MPSITSTHTPRTTDTGHFHPQRYRPLVYHGKKLMRSSCWSEARRLRLRPGSRMVQPECISNVRFLQRQETLLLGLRGRGWRVPACLLGEQQAEPNLSFQIKFVFVVVVFLPDSGFKNVSREDLRTWNLAIVSGSQQNKPEPIFYHC